MAISASSSAERPLQAQMPKLPSTAKGASPTAHVRANALVPIERVTREVNPKFVERQKKELVQRLTLVLTSPQMLPPLITLISEYAVSALTTSPVCHNLFPKNGLQFVGFNVGNAGANRENALFVIETAGIFSQLVRIEEEEEAFVSRAWEIPYSSSHEGRHRVHTVQRGERGFCFEAYNHPLEWAFEPDGDASQISSFRKEKSLTQGRAFSFYDPEQQLLWRGQSRQLIGSNLDASKTLYCSPSIIYGGYQHTFFGTVVSPSRILSAHRDAIRLFSTTKVDFYGECRELDSYSYSSKMESTRLTFVAATSIPKSTRFITALENTGITFFTTDLEHDRFVVQHDFVLNEQEMPGSNHIWEILDMASNSTAVAIVQRGKDKDHSVSLWDHGQAQWISHLHFGQQMGQQYCSETRSWFTDNNVLIIAQGDHGRMRVTDSLSLIDFREPGAKKVVL